MVDNPSSHVLSLFSRSGIFINTSMACSQKGRMTGGTRGDKGGNGVWGPGMGSRGVPGDTRPLGAVDMVVGVGS